MLHVVCCMLYTVYAERCILYTVWCMLYAVCCMLYIVYLMLYVGSMLYAVCFTMLFNVSYCNVPRRFWRQTASFEEGETLSFFICRFKLFLNCYKILTGNHDRILRKSIKNQSKMYPKSLKISPKLNPGGIFGRPGALLGAQEGSGSIFDWFWNPFWDPFGK